MDIHGDAAGSRLAGDHRPVHQKCQPFPACRVMIMIIKISMKSNHVQSTFIFQSSMNNFKERIYRSQLNARMLLILVWFIIVSKLLLNQKIFCLETHQTWSWWWLRQCVLTHNPVTWESVCMKSSLVIAPNPHLSSSEQFQMWPWPRETHPCSINLTSLKPPCVEPWRALRPRASPPPFKVMNN